MSNLYVAMSKANITPELGCLLYGYPSVRHAEKVLDSLMVGVLAIKQNDETVLLIGSDLCAIGVDVNLSLRDAIAKKFDLKTENIILSTTHTHSAPVTRTSAGWGETDMSYLTDVFLKGCFEAVEKSLKSLRPALIAVGKADCYAGINRRGVNEKGQVTLSQNPDGPYDPQLTVVAFKTPEGEFIGSFVHFGAHPTVAGANLSLTRDWPGVMIDCVEELTNAPSMFINGAEGDVGPRLSNGKTVADEAEIEVIGKIAAASAKEAILFFGEFKQVELKLITDNLFLPYVEAPSYESVLKDIEAMGNPDELAAVNITKYSRLQKIKKIYEEDGVFENGMALNHTVISLGDLALVPMPFELFCKISMGIKEGSPFETTLVLGLANGSCGYVPTEDQLSLGGYEVGSFRAATIPGFVDGLDKVIVKENVEFLNKLNKL